MGIGGISPSQLILILAIVILLFGTKKIQSLGEDLGKAIKGFRKGIRETQDLNSESNNVNSEKD
ncbi:MAG: twin-arginine translocase TatA/TatE family subunit [Candidatus Berkiellales bacterium]